MKAQLLASCLAGCAALTMPICSASPTGLDGNGHLLSVTSPPQPSFLFERLQNGIQFHLNGVTKNVIFYGPATVRVNANLGKSYWSNPSIVVIGKPAAVAFHIKDTPARLQIVSKDLQVTVNKATGALTFMDATGRIYTQEHATAPQSLKRVEEAGFPTYEASNSFTLKKDEGIFGFGFVNWDTVNRRNQKISLIQSNIGIVIPMMISSERYGIMWDTYSVMRFSDSTDGATLWAENAPGGVDYYFLGGKTEDGVIANYRHLTGEAPMYPKQAFGLFMSKERYQTEDRLLEVARTFRKEQFPLDYIVQDWQYWGSDKDGSWSGMIWDKDRYPTPELMTKQLHDMNLKLMVSIWPSVGDDTELAKELDSHHLRFAPVHWISKHAHVYDAYSPLGRQIYFKHIKSGLLDKGVDALWMDGTEVEVGTACWSETEVARDIKSLGVNALGDFSRYLNPYTLMTTQGTYDGQRATSDKRVFTLTRSAWTGAQRTAAASWSGDIFASWKTLSQQIAGGLNVTAAGNPYWTQDTGGFFVTEFPGGENNPAYRELYARWMQFAAFNPIMRVHGTSIEREPYLFKEMDPQAYKAMFDAVRLRYRLLPYIYSLSWQVTHSGYTLMRALPMDFPDDKVTFGINDAFSFGSAFLVHPVTHPMYHVQKAPAETIPTSNLITPDGKPGLAGQYFAGVNFETPKGRTVDKTIDFKWPEPPLAEPPGGLASVFNFSARWDGLLKAPGDGEYEIGLEGDDGYRLFLNGKLVVDNWSSGPMRYRSANISLHKGDEVPVRIEFYQGSGDRGLRLAWRTPMQIRALSKAEAGLNLNQTTYLPTGADWYDFWTNEKYRGGQTVDKQTPLAIVPLYVRAGSIVPMGPQVQYATEKPDAPYEIRVYPGANGNFTIYEDDNETYAYEKGRRATYDLTWNDKAKVLKIGARKGGYPGMVKSRVLNLVLASTSNATGIDQSKTTKSVTYTGAPLTVTLSQ
jgi:alpha-D-xyloside xylohydrolase